MANLFERQYVPLATILRPKTVNEIVGQEHLLGEGKPLRMLIEAKKLSSIILWGPAGTGKTTIARVIAEEGGMYFVPLNATAATVKDIRKHGDTARGMNKSAIVFIDECLPYNSLVLFRQGEKPIPTPIGLIVNSSLAGEVLSYNVIGNCYEWRPIISWNKVTPKPLVEIVFDHVGKEYLLRCSEEHLILTENRGYIRAMDLAGGDEAVSPLGDMRVKSVRRLAHTEPLYDIGVADNHNFVADSIVVHNCHRFSKTQQDVLLPYVEEGAIILVGATTENPHHSVNSALISRSHVFVLEPLTEKALLRVLLRGIEYYRSKGKDLEVEPDAARQIVRVSCGDARKVLAILELALEATNGDPHVTLEAISLVAPSKYLILGDTEHFDCASWLQGAIQASDPDAAVFALAKWLESGEDPRYIARRLMVSAAEDAFSDPLALSCAQAAYTAASEIGRPECDIVLSAATVRIALAKRDKSAAMAIWAAVKDVREGSDIAVPKEMRDCHYTGAKQLGHGAYKDGINQAAYVGVNKTYFSPWV